MATLSVGLTQVRLAFFTFLIFSLVATSSILSAQTSPAKAPNVQASAGIQIDASPETVWAALAEDFAGIGKWSSGVAHSQGFGEPIGDSPFSIRACEITAAGFDDTKEQVTTFDENNRVLSYTLFDGLPGFVKDAENTWKLTPKDGGTYLEGTTEMRATGVMGFMMKGIMKGATRNALESMATELKHYVEKGAPHPDKVASIQKEDRKHDKKRAKVTSFTVTQDIQGSAGRAWQVIAGEFGEVHLSHPVSNKSNYMAGYDQPVEGAVRIMYMSDNEKKFFVDKLVELDEDAYKMTVEVIEAEGYPIVAGHTWVNFQLTPTGPNSSRLSMTFNYLTKPAFLKGLAKGSLKKQFADYARSIAHRVETGEEVTPAKWEAISKK